MTFTLFSIDLRLKTTVFTCILFASVSAFAQSPQDLEKFNPYKNHKVWTNEVTAVEVLELRWPSDDILCDSYQGSQGGLSYRIFRDKTSQKIYSVEETGYYCQGDSEYSLYYRFDENGFAVYSESGGNPYVPAVCSYYDQGKEALRIVYESENDGGKNRKISWENSEDVITTAEFEQKLNELRETMRDRITELSALDLSDRDPEYQNEANALIAELSAELNTKRIDSSYVFRKPQAPLSGWGFEYATVNEFNVAVHKEPNFSAPKVASVSFYDLGIQVLEMGEVVSTRSEGVHPWYKIRFKTYPSGEWLEGWIFGAYIAKEIFPMD